VKLSADGSTLLTAFTTGLKSPEDAAVDVYVDSAVYVADTGNSRVRVFSAAGAFLRDITIGHNTQPWGVALSTAGLWVSDRSAHAVYLYSRAGALLKTVSNVGRVRGDALDFASALYVADRPADLVEKFDPNGSPLLNWGSRALADRDDRGQVRFLSDPVDAAIAPDGSLWVADSGHDRVVRYVLPNPSDVCSGFRFMG